MTISRRALAAWTICGLLTLACSRSQSERCSTCGMKVEADLPSRVEIERPGSALAAFDSTRCAIEAWKKTPASDATLYVREYYDQDRRPAAAVKFVEGSDVVGPMGPDAVPVDPARIEEFKKAHGGHRVSSFAELVAPAVAP